MLRSPTARAAALVLVSVLAAFFAFACSSRSKGASKAESPHGFGSAPVGPKVLDVARRPQQGEAAPLPVLLAMQKELDRSMRELQNRAKPAPYYLSYQVIEEHSIGIEASLGGLVTSASDRYRSLDVDIRVGSPELDNTHPLRQEWDAGRYYTQSAWVPLHDEPVALASVLWFTTHQEYERAVEDLIRVRANHDVKVAEEDVSADFSKEAPVQSYETPAELRVDAAPWEERLARVSRLFARHPNILESSVQFEATAENRFFVNSEGSRAQTARTHARFTVSGSAVANDGMSLGRFEVIDAGDATRLPDEAALTAAANTVIRDLLALRNAPLIEPYAGPAILNGRAAGVFFHEIFGHRVEGHRQKSEDEGQTFSRIGQTIMPPFLDVYDDPTLAVLNGVDLNGHYLVDDEGVHASRADLVDDGVLQGFLMSRSPTRGFDRSNGHGRRQRGYRVVARQGNLVIDPSQTTTREGLKQLLIEEVRRQNKPFGLRFTEMTGGFTNTARADAQAFKVLPVMVYKVYPDGREELVRGVDLEGTPLTVLSRIVAAANDFEIFNGVCGAESGWVPVAAASPSLLVSQIEVARREKEQDRPPLLPPPSAVSKANSSKKVLSR